MANGDYPNKAPYGFRNMGPKKGIEIVPDEAKKVKWLYQKYAGGEYSLTRLQKTFNDAGFTYKPDKKEIARSSLDRMLKNPIYYGVMRIKGDILPANHDGIIR